MKTYKNPVNNPETDVRFRDTDDLLKLEMVQLHSSILTFFVNGEYRKAFEGIKALYNGYIPSYEVIHKPEILELQEVLEHYFENLSGSPPKRGDLIIYKKREFGELKKLLDTFLTYVIGSFIELGLWFRVNISVVDVDRRLSEDMFNSDYTGEKEKRGELSVMPAQLLVDSMGVNTVHEVYAYIKLQEAQKKLK